MTSSFLLPEKLVIRVYGILLDEVKGILVADEFQSDMRFTKFPGGGLELGEGTKDCLIREWKEELGQQIKVTDHLYTTDYFQISAFNSKDQLLSIYYRVKALDEPGVRIASRPFDYDVEKEGAISFRWVTGKDFHENVMTFPIDKIVAKAVREEFENQVIEN